MSGDPLELRATTPRVRAAARAAKLSDAALARALQIATATPDGKAWQEFLSRTLALLGAGLALAGVVCFVAYNWARVGRFGKFALVELAMVGATLLAWRKLPKLTGQVSLAAAAVLVGPLLALYGQTYQTGADPYGLFLTWLALIIPWVIAARFSALWVLELVLVDVTLILYWVQVVGFRSAPVIATLPLIIAALHVGAIAVWEWQFRRPNRWLDEHWAPRAAAVFGFVALLLVAAAEIFPKSGLGLPGILGVLGLAGAVAGALYYYRESRVDHFMVTAAVASAMTWVAIIVGRVIFDILDLEIYGFFMMAAFVVFEITVGLKWYRAMRRPAGSEA